MLTLLFIHLACQRPLYVRQCVQEHGYIDVAEYLSDRGLDDCPANVPADVCQGTLVAPKAAICVAREDNARQFEDDQRMQENSNTDDLLVDVVLFKRFRVDGLVYDPTSDLNDLVWFVFGSGDGGWEGHPWVEARSGQVVSEAIETDLEDIF